MSFSDTSREWTSVFIMKKVCRKNKGENSNVDQKEGEEGGWWKCVKGKGGRVIEMGWALLLNKTQRSSN